MSQFISLITDDGKLLTVIKFTGEVEEAQQRLLNTLHHYFLLEVGRHEIVELPSDTDLDRLPPTHTRLRIVTTRINPLKREIKDKHKIVDDLPIAVCDCLAIFQTYAAPVAHLLQKCVAEGRDLTCDEDFQRAFDRCAKHIGAEPSVLICEIIARLDSPDRMNLSVAGDSIRTIWSEDPDETVPGSLPKRKALTLH